jgi:hypothetical protein
MPNLQEDYFLKCIENDVLKKDSDIRKNLQDFYCTFTKTIHDLYKKTGSILYTQDEYYNFSRLEKTKNPEYFNVAIKYSISLPIVVENPYYCLSHTIIELSHFFYIKRNI